MPRDVAVAPGLAQSSCPFGSAAEMCRAIARKYYCGVVAKFFKRARQRANDITEAACFRPRRCLGRD
jgi:hypothetical protein